MTAPSTVPAAPLRTDPKAQFISKASALFAALGTFVSQYNTCRGSSILSTLPTPPVVGSSPGTFSVSANAFLAALPTFVTQLNAQPSGVVLTALPTPPARTDPPTIFIARADAFLGALANFVYEINIFCVSGGTCGGPPPDSVFSNVKLLLHFEGTNGGTTFTDSSGSARTATATGSPTTSTDDRVYGSTSGKFGVGDRLAWGFSSDFELSDVWTLEFRMKPTGTPAGGFSYFWGSDGPGYTTNDGLIHTASTGTLSSTLYGGAYATLPSGSVPLNAWSAIAISCDSSKVIRTYLNGTKITQQTFSADPSTRVGGTPNQVLGYFTTNSLNNNYNFLGLFDEYRFTNHVCRYTGSSYTLSAFPNS